MFFCNLLFFCDFILFYFIKVNLCLIFLFVDIIDKDEIVKKRKKIFSGYFGSNGFGGGGGGGEDGRFFINNFYNGGKWCMKICRKNLIWIFYS